MVLPGESALLTVASNQTLRSTVDDYYKKIEPTAAHVLTKSLAPVGAVQPL